MCVSRKCDGVVCCCAAWMAGEMGGGAFGFFLEKEANKKTYE
jgi:hypothetical protein